MKHLFNTVGKHAQLFRIALIVVFLLTFSVSYYLLHGQYLINKNRFYSHEIDNLSQVNNALKKMLIYKKYAVFSNDVYTNENDSKLISLINKRRKGIEIIQYLPLETSTKGKIAKPDRISLEYNKLFSQRVSDQDVSLTFQGNYNAVIGYLQELEKPQYSITFDRINIVLQAYPKLKCTLLFHYYFLGNK